MFVCNDYFYTKKMVLVHPNFHDYTITVVVVILTCSLPVKDIFFINSKSKSIACFLSFYIAYNNVYICL